MKILNKKIPSNWSEVTIKQFQALSLIEYKDREITLDLIIEVMAALLEVSEEDINSLPFDVLNQINLDFLNQQPKELKYKKEIKVNDKKYELMDNFNLMSMGEFYDLEAYIKEEEGSIMNMHKILSILYTPKKPFISKFKKKTRRKYDFIETNKIADEFLDYMNMEQASTAIGFFLLGINHFMKITLDSLLKEKTRQMTEISDSQKKN